MRYGLQQALVKSLTKASNPIRCPIGVTPLTELALSDNHPTKMSNSTYLKEVIVWNLYLIDFFLISVSHHNWRTEQNS